MSIYGEWSTELPGIVLDRFNPHPKGVIHAWVETIGEVMSFIYGCVVCILGILLLSQISFIVIKFVFLQQERLHII